MPDLGSARQIGKKLEDPDEHPVPVDARMPVIATIECGVIQPGFDGQTAIGKGNARLVRELPLHTAERELGEMCRSGEGEVRLAIDHLVLWLARGLAANERWPAQQKGYDKDSRKSSGAWAVHVSKVV